MRTTLERWWRHGAGLAVLAMVAWLGAGCQTVPYTGRQQLLLTSRSEEADMGTQAWQEIKAKERRANSATQSNAVIRVGQSIAKVADAPDYQWEFVTFESAEPNAFCLPGGKVAVYSGLFQYLANDAELATVVGHEVAHAVARHGGERMSQAMIQQVGAELVAGAAGAENQELWLLAYGGISNLGVVLPYSREHEYEADYMGMIFMAKAGYDPRAALTFWEKFGKLSQGGAVGEFFSTHPMGEKRLEKMRAQLPSAMELYRQAPRKFGLGEPYGR